MGSARLLPHISPRSPKHTRPFSKSISPRSPIHQLLKDKIKKSLLGQPSLLRARPSVPATGGCYLAGVHVPGQLEAPASVAVAGVGPRGVDAGLLTAPLRTLVHICWPQGKRPHLTGCNRTCLLSDHIHGVFTVTWEALTSKPPLPEVLPWPPRSPSVRPALS